MANGVHPIYYYIFVLVGYRVKPIIATDCKLSFGTEMPNAGAVGNRNGAILPDLNRPPIISISSTFTGEGGDARKVSIKQSHLHALACKKMQ